MHTHLISLVSNSLVTAFLPADYAFTEVSHEAITLSPDRMTSTCHGEFPHQLPHIAACVGDGLSKATHYWQMRLEKAGRRKWNRNTACGLAVWGPKNWCSTYAGWCAFSGALYQSNTPLVELVSGQVPSLPEGSVLGFFLDMTVSPARLELDCNGEPAAVYSVNIPENCKVVPVALFRSAQKEEQRVSLVKGLDGLALKE